jgi:hypothetical protein
MTKANWQKFKKQLPYGFDKLAAEILTAQGIQANAQAVRDARRGKACSVVFKAEVWKALHRVKNNYQKQITRIKKLQEG